MRKQKRNMRKQHQKKKTHTVLVRGVGFVKLAPSRESHTPFCAYYGEGGETCSNTTGLKIVGTLPTVPPVRYMACPVHYDHVRQAMQGFLMVLEWKKHHA
jgi:hypothetical protein